MTEKTAAIEEQEKIFQEVIRICHGKLAGAIKGALVQVLIHVILKQSENNAEATDFWNQLTRYAAANCEEHFKQKVGMNEMPPLSDPPWKNKKLS